MDLGWGEPQNMTDYVNTIEDDLGFSIHPNKKTALFSKMLKSEETGEVLQLSLDNKALLRSGIENPQDQDISGLLQDMLTSGYTSGAFAASTEVLEQVGFDLNALPLLTEDEESQKLVPAPEPEPEPETKIEAEPILFEPAVPPVVQQPVPEPEPEPVADESVPEPEPVIEEAVPEPVVVEPEPEPVEEPIEELDPNRLVFRIQILSSSRANSNPIVTISGARHETFEYFYKGAYRVTVGEFETVSEASKFRTSCKNAGYSQAFVAAFRGNERETDPSVFRK